MFTIAVVCCDVGNDLSQGPPGPWLTEEDRNSNLWTMLYPTIQQREKIALKLKADHIESETIRQRRFPQSAALLAQDYGALLDKKLMASDAFYAMNDLFRFYTFSNSQFLNIMESTINTETAHSSMELKKPTLTNLLHCQRILETHLPSLQRNIEIIRQHESLAWPRVSEENKNQHSRAMEAAEELLRDIEHLEERTTELLERCKIGMSVLMTYVMLAESRQAISQGERVAKLTLLAYGYIPLSFTCSFFGMNVTEIVSGRLSIWVWVVTTIPLFVLTVSFLYIDFTKVSRWLQLGWKKLKMILAW
jgi:Mg2+ and Co2+ transporter CorA